MANECEVEIIFRFNGHADADFFKRKLEMDIGDENVFHISGRYILDSSVGFNDKNKNEVILYGWSRWTFTVDDTLYVINYVVPFPNFDSAVFKCLVYIGYEADDWVPNYHFFYFRNTNFRWGGSSLIMFTLSGWHPCWDYFKDGVLEFCDRVVKCSYYSRIYVWLLYLHDGRDLPLKARKHGLSFAPPEKVMSTLEMEDFFLYWCHYVESRRV